MSVLDMLSRYFPQETPEYNQYGADDSLMVQRAKQAAQARAMASEPYFPQGVDTGGYQMGSNQQETLQKLNALQQWQAATQSQQNRQNRRFGPWDALGQVANAYARSQMPQQEEAQQVEAQQPAAPQDMQVGSGVPSVLDSLMRSRSDDSPFLQMLSRYGG